jgi:hypothetical protein
MEKYVIIHIGLETHDFFVPKQQYSSKFYESLLSAVVMVIFGIEMFVFFKKRYRARKLKLYKVARKVGFFSKKEGGGYFIATFLFFLGAFLGSVSSRTPSESLAVTSSAFISSGSWIVL